MLTDLNRVQVLSEALPFIQKFFGRTIVVKYGGAAMKNSTLKNKLIEDILFLSYIGIKPILVHGGGPMINTWLEKVNIQSRFHNGVRVTDKSTMEIVEMVLVGKINKELVTLLNQKKGLAIGLSGKDGNLLIASHLFKGTDNLVGSIKKVNVEILRLLLDSGYIPIISSVAADEHGQSYNVNADTAAGALAEALKAEKLILLTDTLGLMHDLSDPSTLIKHATVNQIQKLTEQKIITDGMIPKVECCVKALKGNVKAAHIIDGRVEHALLLEVLTAQGIGSMITI